MQLGSELSSLIRVVVVVLKLIDLGAFRNEEMGSTPERNNKLWPVDRLIATVK